VTQVLAGSVGPVGGCLVPAAARALPACVWVARLLALDSRRQGVILAFLLAVQQPQLRPPETLQTQPQALGFST
jgi:hypothetical protein